MIDIDTVVVVKNIPLPTIEVLVKKAILNLPILEQNEQLVFTIKNSRTLFLSFPNNISSTGFNLLVNELVSFQDNLISLPEIVAIYKNEVRVKQPNSLEFISSIQAVFSYYKLDKGTLHEIATLNINNCQSKKWWQFWK